MHGIKNWWTIIYLSRNTVIPVFRDVINHRQLLQKSKHANHLQCSHWFSLPSFAIYVNLCKPSASGRGCHVAGIYVTVLMHSATLLMHSATVQCCPRYISDTVHTNAASSRRQGLHSSTDTFSYTVPLTYTKFGERAFSVAGPSVWNSLPADIRHITDISEFKRHLKTYLFETLF